MPAKENKTGSKGKFDFLKGGGLRSSGLGGGRYKDAADSAAL